MDGSVTQITLILATKQSTSNTSSQVKWGTEVISLSVELTSKVDV